MVSTEYRDYQEGKDHFKAAFMHRGGDCGVVYSSKTSRLKCSSVEEVG